MAFKRCEKVHYVDSVSKENKEDSELMKTMPRQKIATKLGDDRTCNRRSCYRGSERRWKKARQQQRRDQDG
jgi:hypothetical protein